MKKIDFNNWNNLRDFIESRVQTHINLMTHIDTLRIRAREILKDDLKKGVYITKDNIHLYYEFMSNEDILQHMEIIDVAINRNIDKIQDFLGFDRPIPSKIHKLETFIDNDHKYEYYLKSYIFGVKDTLRPIEDYIAEIKESEEYKEYISTK